ncbi:hypothetical protein K470DRAFT_280961 [Piedraia hortae CBS 480.64]|uniref:TPR-like protein n=1 Tax=Piedraia hortae CBS 480.64 TaxID=1314780 RepID=A0A6A7C590_9PEZI|nr:hypothetical protein K470DRAFT_280961 [Piedraia hortae CBS 480.64]
MIRLLRLRLAAHHGQSNPAPTTIFQRSKRTLAPKSPTRASLPPKPTPYDQTILTHGLQALHRSGDLRIPNSEAFGFITSFQNLLRDLLSLCKLLLGSGEGYRLIGRQLLYTLSNAGYVEATMHILHNALVATRTQPNVLHTPDLLRARQHLRSVAGTATHPRAMVLDGKIAHRLGDHSAAIKRWTDAAKLIVHNPALRPRDNAELSSPWIELTLLHYERYLASRREADAALAREACQLGCRADDPTSYFHMAYLFPEYNSDGTQRITASWVYNLTKAAASGHVKAAYLLGKWYAESGWPYVEDEPPPGAKPSPFDTYPATDTGRGEGDGSHQDMNSKGGRAGKEEYTIFRSAIFPSTPQGRWTVGMKWLDVPVRYTYAPAHLLAAKMLLAKTLWGEAYAPEEAIRLAPGRYRFASEGDSLEGRARERTQPREDVPNPGYDEDKAKKHLTQLAFAIKAHKLRSQLVRFHEKRGLVPEECVSEVLVLGDGKLGPVGEEVGLSAIPPWIRKWWRFEDVREMWEGEVGELEREAIALLEEYGWEVRDGDGGLVFRPGISRIF